MKMRTIAGVILALGLGQPLLSHADDLFRMSWRGIVYTTGASGQVVARGFSERDFVQKVATDNGLDPRTLVFVYRPNKHDTAVVEASNGRFVADVIQMEYEHTEVSNTTQTKIVRQAFLFVEPQVRIGSAFGTETARYNTAGELINDSFRGTFQYAIDNAVYSGSFSTGARVKDTSGN